MRTLLKFSMQVDTANRAIEDGTVMKVMQSMTDTLRPEAMYFYAENGRRTGIVVFDLKDPSDIPSIAEPLFTAFNASVDLAPVMNIQDVQRGLERAREPAHAHS